MSAEKQLSIFTPDVEAELYHNSQNYGFFSILQKHSSKTIQKSYPLNRMAEVINLLDKQKDSWISQGEFSAPNRRVVNLARIGLSFVDLDYYNIPKFSQNNPQDLLNNLFLFCDSEGIPKPNLVISSGKGLQLKWIYDKALPAKALVRWNYVQNVLVDKLESFGADHKAKDASRVLRLVGTTNTKNNSIAEVIYFDESSIYTFDYLAEWLLPFTREEVKAYKESTYFQIKRAKAKAKKSGKLTEINTTRTLNYKRFNDLKKLAEMRGGFDNGMRSNAVLYATGFFFLSKLCDPQNLFHEANEISKIIAPSFDLKKGDISTLKKRTEAHLKGERIEWKGVKRTPVYTPRNNTLIDMLEITSDEMQELETIIDGVEKQRRNSEYNKSKYRHKAVHGSQEAYNEVRHSDSSDKQKRAVMLKSQGFKTKEICEKLEVSRMTLSRYLKSVT